MVVAIAELGDLLDHLALLVDLDRKDAAVVIAVAGFRDGLAECLVELLDALVEQVLDAQHGGHADTAGLHAADDVEKRDGDGLRLQPDVDDDLPAFGDVEVAGPPVANAVERGAVVRGPGAGRAALADHRARGHAA